LALGPIVLPLQAQAQSDKKLCINACKARKTDCVEAFKNQFDRRKEECRDEADRKGCKRQARRDFKGKKECKKQFRKECKKCCKEDPTVSCSEDRFAVCGDDQQDPGEKCDDGNRVEGDGCSSTCELEPFPVGVEVGTRIFTLGADSKFFTSVLPGTSLGTPTGEFVLQAGEAQPASDINPEGTARVTVDGPFFLSVDVSQLGQSARICTKIDSCEGTLYCNGGKNVDVLVELDSLAKDTDCGNVNKCGGVPEPPCCINACEGHIDNTDPVLPRTSRNTPDSTIGVNPEDSDPGAMVLTCMQATVPLKLDDNPDCTKATSYGPAQPNTYTTGKITARVRNHCPAREGERGTPPDVIPEFTREGENFTCVGWTRPGRGGALAYAIPSEEPSNVLFGDAASGAVYTD
jgi:cysteine-rich repeat protein